MTELPIETWTGIAERLWIPAAITAVLLFFAWRILAWLGVRFDKSHDQQLETLKAATLTFQQIATDAKDGHKATHIKLDAMHDDVRVIRNHLEGEE